MKTKEEVIKFLEQLDYRFNKYGKLISSSEDHTECNMEYNESRTIDNLIDFSDGQFSGGYCEEVYYCYLDNCYRIFEFDPEGNITKFELRGED